MFSPLPLRLWCMASMAPALTEAATQVRAKLTTTAANGRQAGHDCTSAPVDSTDPLAPPRSSLHSGSATGKVPKTQLVTLSKELAIQGTSLDSLRLASADIKTSGGLVTTTGTSSAGRTSSQTLANGKGNGVVNLTGDKERYQIISRQNGTTASTSQLYNPITKPGRMNPPKITLPQASQSTSPGPGGIVMMPHSHPAAPSIQTKTSTMGFTNKTGSQMSSISHTQSTASTATLSDGGPGGVAGIRGLSLNTPSEAENIILPHMGDLATVTSFDLQIVGMGMSDVGLLSNVDLVAETSKRQKEHERRADRLLRRLRRLQSRQSIAHVQEQLSGFVDHQHKNLQTMAKAMKPQPASSVDLKAELLQSEDVKSLSTAALVSLVRKLQTSQALTLRQRLANASQSTSEGGTSVLRLDEDLCTEMNRVSSTLQMDLKHLERAIDSDATESSSGGESCDEDYDYDDDKLPKAYLRRRAEWKWATDRSAVASRWTWLQAQVSDLEYRIRQQSDIYRQIRAAKGAVVLGDPASQEEILAKCRNNRQGRRLSPLEEKIANLERKNEMSPCNLSTLLSNVDKQSSKLTQQLGNVYSPANSPLLQSNPHQSTTPKTPGTPNGFVDLSGTHSKKTATPCGGSLNNAADGKSSKRVRTDGPLTLTFDPPSPVADTSCQAARCRPVRSYGKRKLLRTSGLHQLNRKAARLSTVRCHCFPPVTPCAMCGGRFNNTQTLNPNVMPMAERIALLDPSCHQVLSFPQDTPLPVHFEALLKSGEWQHKPLPYKPMRPVPTEKRKSKVSSMNDHTRKYKKQLSKSASSALLSSANAMRKKRSLSITNSSIASPSPSSSQMRDTPSPLSVSCPSSTLRDLKEAQRRRRGESAFDINNIVIPYSMAASTRVEKLLYKEIITPKWREVKMKGAVPPNGPLASADLSAALPTPTNTPEQVTDLSPNWERPSTPLQNTPSTEQTTSTTSQTTSSTTQPTSTISQPTCTPSRSTSTTSQANPQEHSAAAPSAGTVVAEITPSPKEAPQPENDMRNETPARTEKMHPVKENTPDKEEVPSVKDAAPSCEKTAPSNKEMPSTKEASLSIKDAEPSNENAPSSNKVASSVNEAAPSIKEAVCREEATPPETQVKPVCAEGAVPPTVKEGDVDASKGTAPGGNGLILPRSLAAEEDEEVEDLSDELYAERHLRCEISEKKRFTSVVKKRSRGARADSTGPLGESDITSEHLEQSALAMATPPGTPAMAPPVQLTALVDEELELCGRRRSGSCSSHEDINFGRRRLHSAGKMRNRGLSMSSLVHEEVWEEDSGVEPWATRTFPLDDTEYEILFQDLPPPEQSLVRVGNRHASTTTRGGYTYSTATPENSNPTSPVPSSSNSSVIDDDPNDPEWTVVAGGEKPVPQPGLVLKLAKR